MPHDYTDAPPQRFEPIPHGTIAPCVLHLRPGGVGEDGMLKRSAKGDCEMLDAVLTVVDGPYKGRKIFEYWILAGTTDGHAESVKINHGTLRGILDSALGLKPDDASPQARAARTVSLKDFEGKTFIGKIGVEKGKPKNDGSGETGTLPLPPSRVRVGSSRWTAPSRPARRSRRTRSGRRSSPIRYR